MRLRSPNFIRRDSLTASKSTSSLQDALSEKAGVSRVSINSIENGVYVPSAVLALKIAKVLKCPVEDIFQLP